MAHLLQPILALCNHRRCGHEVRTLHQAIKMKLSDEQIKSLVKCGWSFLVENGTPLLRTPIIHGEFFEIRGGFVDYTTEIYWRSNVHRCFAQGVYNDQFIDTTNDFDAICKIVSKECPLQSHLLSLIRKRKPHVKQTRS